MTGSVRQNAPQVPAITARNDILKLLYAGMLLEMPISQVKEFWLRHPIPALSSADDESLLFKSIWQEKKRNTLEYLVNVINDVEPFFSSQGLDTVSFIKKTFHRINKGMLISAKSILRWGKPFLSYFYLEKDLRPLILRLLDYFTEQLASGLVHTLVKHESDGAWHTATILVMYSQAITSLRLQKKMFERDFPGYDCELWTGMLVQSTPYCVNMPPFEELNMVSDCRTIQQIVPDAEVSIKNNRLLIDGASFGEIATFHAFCEKKKLTVTKYKIPSREIVLINQDYVCPNRKRAVLHAGCAYGAPVYLYSFKYKKGEKPQDFMSAIIDEATEELSDSWSLVQEIHETLIESLTLKADIVYTVKEESITINGNNITKFTPAKILRKMLLAYLKNGQTLFDHKEFIRDEQIIYDPLNPNLNVRLQRLIKALSDNFPRISISREIRGKIRLTVDCKISYHEL